MSRQHRLSAEGLATDLTSQKFGKLTVIARDPNRKGMGAWQCACECGEYAVIMTVALINNRRTSCGCNRRKAVRDKLQTLDRTFLNTTCNINPRRLSIEGMALVMEWQASGHEVASLATRLAMSEMTLRRYINEAKERGFNAWKGYVR